MDNGSLTQPSFAELLRTYRRRCGATQRQLADLSTLSVRAIRNLENGTANKPRKDTVRLIADGLRLSVRERAALEAAGGRAGSGDVKLVYGDSLTRPPAAVSGLIGRDAERAALCGLLSAGSVASARPASRWPSPRRCTPTTCPCCGVRRTSGGPGRAAPTG
jgi:transcriptional regulator with XRE-family HTH domain